MTNESHEQNPAPVTAERPILLVLTSTYPRWVADPEPGFVHELAKRLTDDFHVMVLGPHAPGALPKEVLEEVEVHRYRYAPQRWETLVNDGGIVTNLRSSPWKLMLVPGFVLVQAYVAWRLCRRFQVEVIHAHWLLPQGLIAAFLAMLPGRRVPFLVTSHGADLYALRGRAMSGLKRFVSRRASSLTVVSNAMRDELVRLKADTSRCHVLPMGVDFAERFTPRERARSKQELLFVGRLVEKKGLRILIQAMSKILNVRPEARLTVVGFGPEEERLRLQVKELGLEGAVEFVGAISQEMLPDLYRRAALFVAPFIESEGGDREGLGLVTIEAIACGCPVVAGDLPAVRDILDHPGAGHTLVSPGDSDALAEAVLHVLSDPVSAEHSARRFRAQLLKRFEWSCVAGAYSDLLHQTRAAK